LGTQLRQSTIKALLALFLSTKELFPAHVFLPEREPKVQQFAALLRLPVGLNNNKRF